MEWHPEGGMASAPYWSGVEEMLDAVASAFAEERPAHDSQNLPEVNDDYLSWI
ncbi:hypothetical protein GCM10009745_57440 [Kribbella yunnanensis]|uniref:Uncharacterized protein n=1 Tax=Kribbella yunnanensis TaxID=190194 RepID=A0ABP4UF16_9ACTN